MAEQQILAPDAPMSNGQMTRNFALQNNFGFDGLRGMTRQPAVRKALPLLALTGALGFAALTYFALSAPAQAPLFQGLAEADKAAVADALQASGSATALTPALEQYRLTRANCTKRACCLQAKDCQRRSPPATPLLRHCRWDQAARSKAKRCAVHAKLILPERSKRLMR